MPAPAADTAPTPVQRPRWRKILRITGRVFAGLVILVVLLVAFLHTPWGKSFVRSRVEHALAKKVNGSVSVGSIDYGFLFNGISLRDVAIRDASGKPAIAIAAIDLDLVRSALLDKEIILNELTIDGLAVDVVKHKDGTSNLTGLFKKSNGKPLGHVKIGKLSVKGRATIVKADGSLIAVRDLAIDGSVDARPVAKTVDATLTKLAAQVEARGKKLDVAIETIGVKRNPEGIDVEIAKIAAGVVGERSAGPRSAAEPRVIKIEQLAAHVKLDKQAQQAISIGKLRVDKSQLALLLGREVVLDDIAMQLSVTGPGSALAVKGGIKTRDTTLDIDGVVDAAAAMPSYKVSLVGKGKSTDVVVPVPGKKPKPPVETAMTIVIDGKGITKQELEATIDVDVGNTTVGKIAIDSLHAHAIAKQGNYTLENLVAKGLGFEVTAKGELVQKVLDAHVTVSGSPAEAVKVLTAAGIAIPRRVPNLGKLDLAVTAKGRLDGQLDVTLDPTTIPIAGGAIAIKGDATLEKKQLQIAHTSITLKRLDLAALSRLAGRPPKAQGSLSGNLSLTKTATTRDATFDLAIALRDKPLVVTAKGTAELSSAVAHLEVRRSSDRSLFAAIDAKLPLDAKGFAPRGAFEVSADVANRQLEDIKALLPERLQAKVPPGAVAIHAELAGSPVQPTGTIEVTAALKERVHLVLALKPTPGRLSVQTTGELGERAKLSGTLAMPFAWHGKKPDVVALRNGLTVDATIDIPERQLASLAYLRPNLAKFDGLVGGQIKVRGAMKTPKIAAALAWKGYRTADGGTGETKITAAGSPSQITATIEHGGAVKITAAIDRSNPQRLAVKAQMRAQKAPLLPLLPAFAAKKLEGKQLGTLDWNMDADVVLAKSTAGMALDSLALTGGLDVGGASFAIPNTKRVYRDIALSVAGEPDGVRIKSLIAHESDRQNADRKLAVSGFLALDKAKPKHVDLSLVAKDWLVFGGEKLGMPDAPRATASFDIGVAVDLAQPIIGVDATVKSLSLLSPDRMERGHFAEKASTAGDIIFVKGTAGKLPSIVAPVAPVVAAPKQRRALDVRVHIPQAIHLEQTPMDLMAKGELTITVRDEGVKTRGKLVMESGTLDLFGKKHALVEGSVTFDEQHPGGWMAITFEHELPRYAMRELAKSGGARVTFNGSPTKPKTSLSGNANAAMFEFMAMYNAGRPVTVTRPGLPASGTVQAPRGDQLFMLTFMASNLPHLLFLDRVQAWSEPDRDGRYGRIDNMEAEKYASDQKSRVRAVVRPATPGRSNAELQYDRMLINNDRSAVGVGVRAGDRLGGGIGLFFEWSSR